MKNSDVAKVQELIGGGQFQAALEYLDTLLPEASWDVGSALFKGIACQELGINDGAETSYRKAINLGLKNVTMAWKNLAVMFYGARRYAEVVDLIEAYRDWQPDDLEAIQLLGNALIEQENYPEAERVCREWLEQRPDDATVLLLLQYVLQNTGRRFESLFALAKASEGAGLPAAPILEKIFGILLDFGWIEVADQLLRLYQASVGTNEAPSPAILWTMSSVAFEKGDHTLAVRHLEAMLTGFPLSDRARYNISMRLLALGNLELGWQLYRLRSDNATKLIWDEQIPKWSGENLDGKAILVFSEQGAGDVIQFLRFVPLLEKRGIRCTFVAYEDIVGLLAAAPGAEVCGKVDFDARTFDYQLQLMDLAVVCGVRTAADIPATVPYLYAPKATVSTWKARLDALPGVKVGLVWAGNPDYGNDHWRSSSLRELAGLAALPGVSWVALQQGRAAGEDIPEGMNMLRLGGELKDYADTAAVIDSLDLVISVDTSVAHLAGALGKPVWILLPRRGKDWRWFLEECSSPWYPSARLFTQSVAGCWNTLIKNEVRPALASFLLERSKSRADIALWQQRLLRFLGAAATSGLTSATVADGLPDDQLSQLLPFARVLAKNDGGPALLDAIWRSAGPLGGVVWAECSVREGEKRTEALALLREFRNSGGEMTSGRICAYLFALMESGELQEARSVLREANAAFPDNLNVKYMASLLAEKSGNRKQEIRRLGEVIEKNPRLGIAHFRLYELHRAKGSMKFALAHLERAILLAPDDFGLMKHVARELRVANYAWLSSFLLACLCKLDDSEHNQLARAVDLAAEGDAMQARELFEKISLGKEGSDDFAAIYSRAQVLRGLNDWPAALEAWEHGVRIRPNDKTLRFVYGWDLLSLGKIDDGWQNYAQGLEDKISSSISLWDGVERPGARLLVYQDQGQGDLLQFFVLVKSLPASMRVTLAVNPSLRKLLQAQKLPCALVVFDEVEWLGEDYDFRVGLMTLPSLIGADLLAPARNYPYLVADQRLLPRWKIRTAQDPLLKVGIVWAGNPSYGNDAFRSSLLKDWRPLLRVGGVSLYNLQKDASSNQALALPEFDFHNIVADCDSWQKTAAAVSMLDLVISVDSGVLHLAACLGIETWGLLPHSGTDFRWLREREDCPWYPSVTLIRQQREEDWHAVLQRVAVRLVSTKAGLNWRS